MYRSKNHLEQLPDAIGSLINLQVLHLQHNQLAEIPDTICGLVNLTEIDLAHNQLTRLSPYIGHLKKLRLLYLNHNYNLSNLPIEMGGLEGLTTLAVLHCPQLKTLPAELLQLPNLRRLKIASCPQEQVIRDDLTHNPPSLLEICARQRIKDAAYYFPHSPKPCSACGKPYFESYVSRRRLVERPDSTLVMFEYRLCSAHWTDDQDRMRYIFSHSQQQPHDVLQFLPPIVDQQPHRSSRIYGGAHPSIEEEKIATPSWRPQRFLKGIRR
ncbi:hypothetical protein BJV82DRAFT_509738 [Fennellomyces sp. T-0311]|nr:hypothetical protein BJV82DRAFT_509738 [Fennellomyces sp. T-0311]